MIKKYFKSSNDRTQKANLNNVISLFFRGGSIFLTFILVPLTLDYIKPDGYGIWITLSSIVGWVAMFDIGIANGLKNKLSECLAVQNYEKARMFVSTTYVLIGMIAFSLICVYFIFYQFVSWQNVFNSRFIPEYKLRNVVSIVAVLFLLKFVTDIINVVSAAFQMVSVSSILLFISNLGITLSVWILSKTTRADMILLAFTLSFIPFFVSVIASVYLFKYYFKAVKPSFKYLNFKESKSIVRLGSQFFILQIMGLIIFQTDNILIAQFFNLTEVTKFNVAFKYYSIISVFFSVVLMPYWTAFTEAYLKKDFRWIETTMKRLKFYWIASVFLLGILFLIRDWVFSIWLGNIIKVPINLSISICAYIAVINWNSILGNFLNGIGKIKVQIIVSLLMGILNISLSFLFVCKFKMGVYAVTLSNFLSLMIGAILCYVQYKKIINNNASGIWNK